jgi:hypothetical protein
MGALKQNWDSFSFAVITCFNIMQKENWNYIIFQVAQIANDQISLYIYLIYLIFWQLIGNHIILNLFLSSLLEAFFEDLKQ